MTTGKRSFLTAVADCLTFGATRRSREQRAAPPRKRVTGSMGGSSHRSAAESAGTPDFDDYVPRSWAATPVAESYPSSSCSSSGDSGGSDGGSCGGGD